MAREFLNGVYFVGAIDWDRRLFDELVALPGGTSYNSYLIKGSEKVALIDTVDPSKKDDLLLNLSEALKSCGNIRIDYIISNHAEQDHSGSIPVVLEKYPNAKVVCNPLCKVMLQDELKLQDDKFIVINDLDELSLGDKTLKFIFTPWVHWPETMCTLLVEQKIIFTCDFFGSHLATSQLYVSDPVEVYEGAKRYYSEIMQPFASIIVKNMEKLESYSFEIIAPSHGPMYKENLVIRDWYYSWTSHVAKRKAVVIYASMHGSTKHMADCLVHNLIDKGMDAQEYNLTNVEIGKVAMAMIDASTLIVASPTYLTGLHPVVASALYIINSLHSKTKLIGFLGTSEWGGHVEEEFKMLTSNFRGERLAPLMIKGAPSESNLKAIGLYAEEIIAKNSELKDVSQGNDDEILKNKKTSSNTKIFDVNVKILEVINETPSTKTFICEKPYSASFKAGQYVMLGFADNRKISNKNLIPITIASAPNENVLRFTVKSMRSFSKELCKSVCGDVLHIKGPLGSVYVIPDNSEEDYVFLSGGSGITPFLSILRDIRFKNRNTKIVMINCNRNFDEIICRQELDALSHGNIFIMNSLDFADSNWKGERGVITKDMILRYVKDISKPIFMVSGPPLMVENVVSVLDKLNVKKIVFDSWKI